MILLVLVSLAIPVALVVAVILAARRRTVTAGPGPGGGTSSVRRFFQYLLLFALTVVAAIGISDLLGRALGADTAGDGTLAQSLSFAIVGLPLAGLIAWWTRRSIREDPREASALAYSLYVTLAAWTALVVAMVALQGLVSGALRGSFDGQSLAMLAVWGGVWVLHWSLARRLGDARNWPHLLLGSLIGLVTAAVALSLLLGTSLDALLLEDSGQLVLGAGLRLSEYGATFATGALVWTRYWPTAAARLPRTTAWLVYVLPIGVGGGLLTALICASLLLWQVLVWLVGDPFGASAEAHFADSPRTFAFAVVGLLLWWYHRAVLGQTRQDRTEVRRVYEYLAGIAGVAAVVALIVAMFVLLEDVVDATISTETLRSMRYVVGVLVTAAAVSGYHYTVFREDRKVVVPDRHAGPRSVILVGAPAPGLDRAISRATGTRVELLHRADGAAPDWSQESLLATLREYPGADLLVVAGNPPDVVVLDREHGH